MKNSNSFWSGIKQPEYYTGVILLAVATFMLCIFEPCCVYFQNSKDFIFDIYTLFPICICLWGILTTISILIYMLMYIMIPKVSSGIVYLCFSTYLCLYIQGNYFVEALSILDGSEVDWSQYTSQYIQSFLLWIGIFIGIALLFFILKKDRFYKLVRTTSVIMLLMFIVTALITGYFNYGFDRKPAIAVTDMNLTEYSDEKNFIILITDMVDVEYENIVLEKYPGDKEGLKDFTYYDNVVSGYCYTDNSLPFILSGKWYEGQEKFDHYKEWCYLESPFINELKKQDYILGMYTDELSATEQALQLDNTVDITRKLERPVDFAKTWIKLVGYKYLPYPLKQFSQVLPSEFEEPFSSEVDNLKVWDFYESNQLFYTINKEEKLTIAEDGRPRFKFIHIKGAHHPYSMDRGLDMNVSSSYVDCVEGTNMILKTYLERLRADGAYDNSVIMILADHGTTSEGCQMPVGHQDPILFIKGIGETHDVMITDSAPISQEDFVSAYFRLLAGEEGNTVFDYKEGDIRERRCLLYQNGRYEEYIQKGYASDLTTFVPSGKTYLPLK